MTPQEYLRAMRVPHSIRPQEFGLWRIERYSGLDRWPTDRIMRRAWVMNVGWRNQTLLKRLTMEHLHLPDPYMDVVMEDSRSELARHLPFVLDARGRVLMTGLGLGCALRGALANPAVTHVDLIEMDRDILRIVGVEFLGNPRVTFHSADALEWPIPKGAHWDTAWHDLCHDANDEKPNLTNLHAEVLTRFHSLVDRQGAWQFPRLAKRMWTPLLGSRRRQWRVAA